MPDPTTTELLAEWDAYDLFDYADDSEGFAALVAIAEPMVERLRAGVSPQPEIPRDLIRLAIDSRDYCQCGYVAPDGLEPSQRFSALGRHMTEQKHATAKGAVWALLADGATPADTEAET